MTWVLALMVLAAGPTESPAYLKLPAEEIRIRVAPMSATDKVALLDRLAHEDVPPRMTDDRIRGLFAGIGPEVMLAALRGRVDRHPTYECLYLKQERIQGAWNDTPDRIWLRVRSHPLALDLHWLRGGRHPGREVSYDAARDPGHLIAHEAGILGLLKLRLALDSSWAMAETHHPVTDLGFDAVLERMDRDRRLLVQAGLPVRPVSSRSLSFEGRRSWEVTFATPGPPRYAAARTRVVFDLSTDLIEEVELYDAEGTLEERHQFEEVRWTELGPEAFRIGAPLPPDAP